MTQSTLTVEDGTGVNGADSYCTTAYIDTYWGNRPQLAFSTAWLALDQAHKDGCAREATAYLDAMFGPYYRGRRRGFVQGLFWPRSDALDIEGYPLPDLPPNLMMAVAELAARAASAPLADDLDRGGDVRTLKAGSVEITYAPDAAQNTRYGIVNDLIANLLTGSQPHAPNERWTWA